MSPIINHPEINSVLFNHQRMSFDATKSTGKDIIFKDSSSEPIIARFFSTEKNSPNIIFYPSTETPLVHIDEMARSYNQHGINVLVFSYRGDNGSSKVSTLDEFYEDGRILFEQALSWLVTNEFVGSNFVMGQSLGSILAIDTVFNNLDSVKGILLESAMCQTAEYLTSKGVDTSSILNLEEQGFGNVEKIEKIELPTLIFHGAKDSWIPITDAEQLQASSGARTKQFFIIPGAQHEFLYRSGGNLYFETIKKFIDTLCGVNTWRKKRRKYLEDQAK